MSEPRLGVADGEALARARSETKVYVQFPSALWMGLGLIVPLVLMYSRRWDLLKLMVFCLPLMAPPLLIFSKGGMSYSIHHLLSMAILIALSGEWTRVRWGRKLGWAKEETQRA